MTLTLQNVLAMARRTVSNPREGAEEVLALGVPRDALWTVLLLVVVLSIILGHITTLLLSSTSDVPISGLIANPLATGVLQFALLIVMILGIHYVGRAFGGMGSMDEAILLMSWLQFIMVCVQVIQTFFLLFIPPLASLVGFAGLILFMWLLTNFISVIHGFRSLGQVFAMILVTMFGFAFALAILLTIFGVSVDGAV